MSNKFNPAISHMLKITILCLVFISLTACQAGGGIVFRQPTTTPMIPAATATPSPIPTTTPTVTPTPEWLVPLESLAGLKLQFWHPWSGELATELEKLVDQFNQTNEWGIHVIVQRKGSSMALAQELEAAQPDQRPDFVIAPSEMLWSWQAKDGRLEALDSLANDSQFGMTAQQRAEIPTSFWQQDEFDGQLLGVPAQRTATVLFYNQTWATELGFKQPPATTADFKAQACAAAKANNTDSVGANDGTGGWLINTRSEALISWLRSFGVKSFLKDEELVFYQPETLAAFQFIRGLVDEECAWAGRLPAPDEYFAARQALFYTGTLQELLIQTQTNKRINSSDQWMILPFPGEEKPVVIINGLSYAIMKHSAAETLASWLFIRWISNPDAAALLTIADGGFPVNTAAVEKLGQFQAQYPQWGQSLGWIPFAEGFPQTASWQIAQFILEDAGWQSLQPYITPEKIPQLVQQLDATIREVLGVVDP